MTDGLRWPVGDRAPRTEDDAATRTRLWHPPTKLPDKNLHNFRGRESPLEGPSAAGAATHRSVGEPPSLVVDLPNATGQALVDGDGVGIRGCSALVENPPCPGAVIELFRRHPRADWRAPSSVTRPRPLVLP